MERESQEDGDCRVSLTDTDMRKYNTQLAIAKLTISQMMRYRGMFQRSSYPLIPVDAADEGEVLENKWRRWYEKESWKRSVPTTPIRLAQLIDLDKDSYFTAICEMLKLRAQRLHHLPCRMPN
jgi:hypothetical protein